MTERRQKKRFAVPDNAFAVLHSNSIIVTSLTDINMAGLSFEYMIDGDDYLENAKELDIFCEDDDFYDFHLQNVPFKITSQAQIPAGDHVAPLIKVRCGVKFGELTPAQASRLAVFVKHFTTCKAQDMDLADDGDWGGKGLFKRMTFVF